MVFGNFISRDSNSAEFCAESVRISAQPSFSFEKMVRGAGFEPATPSV
jgi:hypothetical protein